LPIPGAGAPTCAPSSILVIGGNEAFRRGLVENLEDDGHPVIDCRSPQFLPPAETLASLDAILLDDPHSGDGWQFARSFHRHHPEIPIVVATVQCSAALARVAWSLGSLVHKPIDYDELHAFLHAVILRAARGGSLA
jgi:DNA-binding response OmpR family regulator